MKTAHPPRPKPGVVSTRDACFVLGVHENTFRKHAADPQTELIGGNGKWIWSSVVREFERLYGVPYSKATV